MNRGKLVIRFEKVVGRRVAHPVNREARLFAEVIAAATVPGHVLVIAKALGFEIEVDPSPAGDASNLAAFMDRDGRAS